ncbi:RtcB family protein [Haloferax mediterranei ATCC 33500]|uniref:tRNA-splicing ligase RtcB n=1 Tax=Haloferax mediterranei (strain ATCC 33500 / DSM 1411 / JCM 8866 / NBRC 14739 / NCIMB 2177 / R-4) TaxID=523841 RepID=I3R1Y0_HALMT|nr:RtcB family protein [Haloferax mediterranei]AFK18240.1 rtcB-like protein [Haloferax mediterranei ATCC 33500]AHZ22359.1 tRNA-splicing ligase [Haloferax mediterranei ATCC 33500]EMA02489.1 rtcB-like protein [Haloferax mediterranei ATCC 33500]MDX5988328.1 RtcB family protein [Haloferax mediterranei ATCC 33500]QCQ74762.1 RtcB family protein [Haloferax mediterranei ATCC 33500]
MGLVVELNEIEANVYEIGRTGEMRVPARVYGSESLVEEMQSEGDRTLTQIQNVAMLPGIQKFSLVLPDGHQGDGFPIGGVAAVDADDGVISPGGIGGDINCGVRLLRTGLTYKDIVSEQSILADRLYQTIPTGAAEGGSLDTNISDVRGILEGGLEWMLANGHATKTDLDHCEENGHLPSDPNAVPTEALKRGVNQVGSLGRGNHFLEVQRVTDVYDTETAAAFGIDTDDVVVMIHTGSRGLGHQTYSHYLRAFERKYRSLAESLPDKKLVYAPLGDDLADEYWNAMNAAANFAWANRQALTQAVRKVFDDLFDTTEVELVYDVCHNMAKEERHTVDGETKTLLVHRKGATRAFPAGRPEIPEAYRSVGQPVFIPGSMGSHSYILVGGPQSLARSFGSTAHGAGRQLSRAEARTEYSAGELKKALRARGIFVRARSGRTLAEEAPGAYKDIDEVVRVSDALGIGTRVARTAPLANIKG